MIKMMRLVRIRDGIYDLLNENVREGKQPRKAPETEEERIAEQARLDYNDGYLQGCKDSVVVVERAIDAEG